MTAVRGFFGHLGFVWNRNLWRLLVLLAVMVIGIVLATMVFTKAVAVWQAATRAGNEAATVQNLKTIAAVEAFYFYGHNRTFGTFEQLMREQSLSRKFAANPIDGYNFVLAVTPDQTAFSITADPAGASGGVCDDRKRMAELFLAVADVALPRRRARGAEGVAGVGRVPFALGKASGGGSMIRYKRAAGRVARGLGEHGCRRRERGRAVDHRLPQPDHEGRSGGLQARHEYTLGANTGFTFEQAYLAGGKVSAHALPPTGQVFVSNYVAMPVGNKQLMVTWYADNGTLNDVFVMNFQTGVVSDVAPGPSPPSLGTVTITQKGASSIPPP